jgi:hypothetical protein
VRLEGETWAGYLNGLERSAFRLELLPQYLVEPEREPFAAFRRGEPMPPGHNAEWHATIRAHAAAGRTMQRVHLVTPPLSDYLRFEFEWAYIGNTAAGEDTRILDLSRTPDPGLPDFDFWLFDETTVVAMLYEPDGTQIGRELLQDADPAQFVGYRDLALAAAVPFAEYWRDVARS